MAGKELIKTKAQTLKAMLMSDSVKSALQFVASKSLDLEQLANIAYTAATRNPALLQCDPRSIVHCMVQAAQDGLILEGANQHSHAIPFANQAVYIVGYRGLLHLLRRAIPGCQNIYTRLVKEYDLIEIEDGFVPKFRHVINVKKERGNVIGAYAMVHIEGWQFPHYEYMDIEELDAVKEKALRKGGAAWKDKQALPEQQRKTVLKRMIKVLETTPQMAEIIGRDNRLESGKAVQADFEVVDVHMDLGESKKPKSTAQEIKDDVARQQQEAEDFAEQQQPPDGEILLGESQADNEFLTFRNMVMKMLDKRFPHRIGGKNPTSLKSEWCKKNADVTFLVDVTNMDILKELADKLATEIEEMNQ